MAKRSRVRALLTETTRPEVTPPSQSQPAVVALPSQQPTYRYSGRRKARVTDFLLEEAPEPDPTLPEIRLIPLTAEEEMAKKNRVRALLTETNRPEVPPPSQTQPAVVALPSQQPSSSRPSKRARSTPTEQQLVDEDESILPLSPQPILQPGQSDRADSSKWAPYLLEGKHSWLG